MNEQVDGNIQRFKDFRKMLEMKELDAVVISTPDHWHAIQTIQACESGRDVYVEKPLTISIAEGRANGGGGLNGTAGLSQVGLQRRSSAAYAQLQETNQGQLHREDYNRQGIQGQQHGTGWYRQVSAEPAAGGAGLGYVAWTQGLAGLPGEYSSI